jgi:transposase
MGRPKKEKVILTDDELKHLKSVMRKKNTAKTIKNRCQVLIDIDEAHGKILTYEQSAKSNGICLTTVSNVAKDYRSGGIDEVLAYNRNSNSDQARRKLDGRGEAKIIEIACGQPPVGHSRWTLRLLEEKCKVELEIPVSKDTIGRALKKNELRPHRNEYWCIPPKENAEFVACMEDILDVYETPYDSNRPVVCMDEKPYQMLGEVREPLRMRPGDDLKLDSEYKREGTCSIFAFTEPLAGVRHVNPREHRTAVDWAEEIKYLVDVSYPDAEKIILVMDNLNTHAISSLYKAFKPEEARRIARKLELHFTPKHGSWLNMCEIELNVMTRQCLARRINNIDTLRNELTAWEADRNSASSKISWHFRTGDSREKLISLYPKIL